MHNFTQKGIEGIQHNILQYKYTKKKKIKEKGNSK